MPPRWRDIGVNSRVLALNDGLASRHSRRSAVTINLGHDVEALLLRQKSPAAWMGKRISLALKPLEEVLGRELDFWIVLEAWTKKGPRRHFHGVVTCSPGERPAVENALKQAAGEWK